MREIHLGALDLLQGLFQGAKSTLRLVLAFLRLIQSLTQRLFICRHKTFRAGKARRGEQLSHSPERGIVSGNLSFESRDLFFARME